MPARDDTIAIVGCGPMGTYTLKHLIMSKTSLRITVFEATSVAGCGMPYRDETNAAYMYCNAFSREIPVLTCNLATWLKKKEDDYLASWELKREDIDARAFYPRVLLGEYMKSEFLKLCEIGRKSGHEIEVLTRHRVVDISQDRAKLVCHAQTQDGQKTFTFKRIVIATGHVWDRDPVIDEAHLVSPWPFTQITSRKPGRIGILGSSLSAIDTIVALGQEHGTFLEENDKTRWFVKDGREDLFITMVSHRGIMPEPDFFYPFPYTKLNHIHADAVREETTEGTSGLLNRVFALLIAELIEAAPDYMASLGTGAVTIEGFSEAYFQHREDLGGLRALNSALSKAVQSFADNDPQQHRYALLRGHENFELILEHLDDADWQIFCDKLMPVFGDCYAAIPHVSVRRILALHDAGILEILPTGFDARFKDTPDGGVTATTTDGLMAFDTLIDARGQSSAPLAQLPFPSLIGLIAKDQTTLFKPFRLKLNSGSSGEIYCLAMPQVLERHPFSQGLANCHDIGRMVAEDISKNIMDGVGP